MKTVKNFELPAASFSFAVMVLAALFFAGCLGGNENPTATPLPTLPPSPSFEIPSFAAISPVPTIEMPSIPVEGEASPVPSVCMDYSDPFICPGVAEIGEKALSVDFELVVTNVSYPPQFYDPTLLLESQRNILPHAGYKFVVINFTVKRVAEEPWHLTDNDCSVMVDKLESLMTMPLTGTKLVKGFGYGAIPVINYGETADGEFAFEIPVGTQSLLFDCRNAWVRII